MKKGSFDFANFDSLDRSEMKKLMAGSDGWCIPGYPCNTQQNCDCVSGFRCCCEGILQGCFTTVADCRLACGV